MVARCCALQNRSYVGPTMTQRPILPVVPTQSLVMFPGVVMSLELSGEAGRKLADEMSAGRAPRAVLVPGAEDAQGLSSAIGVEVELVHVARRGDRLVIVVRGLARVRVVAPIQLAPFLTAEVEAVDEAPGDGAELDALVRAVRDASIKLVQLAGSP